MPLVRQCGELSPSELKELCDGLVPALNHTKKGVLNPSIAPKKLGASLAYSDKGHEAMQLAQKRVFNCAVSEFLTAEQQADITADQQLQERSSSSVSSSQHSEGKLERQGSDASNLSQDVPSQDGDRLRQQTRQALLYQLPEAFVAGFADFCEQRAPLMAQLFRFWRGRQVQGESFLQWVLDVLAPGWEPELLSLMAVLKTAGGLSDAVWLHLFRIPAAPLHERLGLEIVPAGHRLRRQMWEALGDLQFYTTRRWLESQLARKPKLLIISPDLGPPENDSQVRNALPHLPSHENMVAVLGGS